VVFSPIVGYGCPARLSDKLAWTSCNDGYFSGGSVGGTAVLSVLKVAQRKDCLCRQECKSAAQSSLFGQVAEQTHYQFGGSCSCPSQPGSFSGTALEFDCETGDVRKLSHRSKKSRLAISYLIPCRHLPSNASLV
jgi:hypothetical protein